MTDAELLALGLYHLRHLAADQTAGPYNRAAQAVLDHIAELEKLQSRNERLQKLMWDATGILREWPLDHGLHDKANRFCGDWYESADELEQQVKPSVVVGVCAPAEWFGTEARP
jgi:hypothetical protein